MRKLLGQLSRCLRSLVLPRPGRHKFRFVPRCARAVFLTLIACGGTELQAVTTYFSTGSADVNTLAHWTTERAGAGTSPADFASGDCFVIQNGHSMTTAAAWTVSGTGNKILIESGGSLAATYPVATATFQIDDQGTYIHNSASGSANGDAGDIPGSASRSFSPSSTVEIQKWANGGTAPAALPSGVAWGNLRINVASLAGDWRQLGRLAPVGFLPYLQKSVDTRGLCRFRPCQW